jgi:hypothetical protein
MNKYHAIAADLAARMTAEDGPGKCPRLLTRVSESIETCTDYYAASAMYEELSRRSDAELRRRGLTRESLARDICVAADRTSLRADKHAHAPNVATARPGAPS